MLKTCTGSKKCNKSKPESSLFLHFLSLCRFWSLGCLKPAQAQKNAKNQTWKLQNLHRLKKCKKCKTQMQCQRSGLDWSGFLHFLHVLSLCRFWSFQVWIFLHFLEPVQVLEPWVLKTFTRSKKCKKKSSLFLFFLSLCRFWSLGCLKPAQAQKNAKKVQT